MFISALATIAFFAISTSMGVGLFNFPTLKSNFKENSALLKQDENTLDLTVGVFSRKNDKIKRKEMITPTMAIATPTPTITASPLPTATVIPATPTATATPNPTSTPLPTPTQIINVSLPSQILNLLNWKLTLPTGSSGSPTEIRQPSLATFKIDPWFVVNEAGNGVRFRAPVNGVTTSGSSYPRSELREMISNGSSNASWSSTAGTHTMTIDQAITALPKTKRHVVAGQIHDSSDDIMVIRLESSNLYVNVDGKNILTLDSNYTLGKRFTVKFVASGGKTAVYYNNSSNPSYVLDKSYSGAYFKAGAYTQSNCSRESSGDCNSGNYGEVVIYNVTVTHS